MNSASGIDDLTPIADLAGMQQMLVVDRDPATASRLRVEVASLACRTESLASGREAIQRLERRDIDLLVIDPDLPDLDGLEVLSWLLQNHVTTLVIVLSNSGAIELAIQAHRLGALDFIRKTAADTDLGECVRRALGRRRQDQKRAIDSARLEQSERLHRFLVEQSPDLIYTLDSSGHFIFINGRVESLLGYSRHELLGKHYSVIVHEDDIEHARYAFRERRIGDRATTNFEVRLKNNENGTLHFDNRMVVAILSSQGIYGPNEEAPQQVFMGTTGVARDITARKQAEDRIAHQAFHDLLTGLPNRTLFMDRLALALTQAKRRAQRVGLMFLDIDRFKQINDTYGHLEGDELLKEFAVRTRRCLRSGDTLARLGGDEFTVLLPDVSSSADITKIARKMLGELKTPFTLGGQSFTATVSIGIAIYPDDGSNIEELLHNADLAMYQTKSQGKNGYREFSPTMSSGETERLSLENDLRLACETNDQFELLYQPIVSTTQKRIIGIEALIRWHHPTRGILTPPAFIPLAEECSLIFAISDWMLETGCAQLARLRARGLPGVKLVVNLAQKEFERRDLLERLISPLGTHGLNPEDLELDISEGLLLKNAEMVIATVRQLRRVGMQISIDDFGTRYSSLNYLRRFSVSGIKVDPCFIRDLGTPHGSTAILDAIFGVARSFGLDIVAKGVETTHQQRILSELGVDEMQGHLYGEPMSGEALEASFNQPRQFAS